MKRRTFLPILASPLAAQTKAPEVAAKQPPPDAKGSDVKASEAGAIKVSVNEVIVPVTVTDSFDRFVSDLEEKDFQIFEEGKQQKIIYFNRERSQPVVVGFLIDVSNANRLHWKTFQDASVDLIQTLLPGEKKYSGYLISYGTDAELQVNTHYDPEKMMEKVRKLKPGGGAALYDAIYMACTSRDLVKGEPIEPRRIIVVVGDGHDTASKKTLDEVLELAQRNLVTIYGVSTTAFGFAADGEKTLERLAKETGGRVEYPLNKNLYKEISGYLSTPSDEGNYALKVGTGGYASEIAKGMFQSIAKVAGEITTQYIMRYIPAETDSAKVFRNIDVKVNLPNVRVRARKGYYPSTPR
ncbi:MAG: VWA domain-containing protein [Bryobacteraceae bacterium]